MLGKLIRNHNFLVLDSDYPPMPIIGNDILKDKLKSKLVFTVDNLYALSADEVEIESQKLKGLYSHIDGQTAKVEPVVIKLKEGVNMNHLRQKPYKTNDPVKMKRMENELVSIGIMIPGLSPICSPAFLRPKPENKDRYVVNYKLLNTMTIHVSYPLPLISDYLQSFAEYVIFTVFDFENGFFNIPVTEETGRIISVVSFHRQHFMLTLGQGNKQSVGEYKVIDTFGKKLDRLAVIVDDCLLYDMNVDNALDKLNYLFKLRQSTTLASTGENVN